MITFFCEHCNKEAGPEMIRCPERASGNCPYVYRQDRPNLRQSCRGWFFGIGGFLTLIVASFLMLLIMSRWKIIIASTSGEEALIFPLILCAILVMGLIGIAGGFFQVFSRWKTLFNPSTGAMWQQRSLFDIKIEQVTMTAMQPLSIDLKLPRELQYRLPPKYPASIAVLCLDAVPRWPYEWNKAATDLFAAVLTLLLAQGALGVGRTTVIRSTFGRQSKEHVRSCRNSRLYWRKSSKQQSGEYLLIPGSNVDAATVDGVLEQQIMKVVVEWAQQPAARELPVAPTVVDLAHILITDAYYPGDRLVRMVQDDAGARELGTISGGFFETKRKFVPNPTYVGRLKDEGEVIRALQEALWQSQLGLCSHMFDSIECAISSRTLDPSPMSD